MTAIENLKILLGITDDTQDALLTVLKDHVQKRICTYIGQSDFPTELNWVADEVSVKRYNRLSSEGISGITHKFEESMLTEFKAELDLYIVRNSGSTGGTGSRLVML
jgi:hypothetical protein